MNVSVMQKEGKKHSPYCMALLRMLLIMRYMSTYTKFARGRLTLSALTMALTLELKGSMSSSTSGEQWPKGFRASILGMHPMDPTPAMTNFRAPRLYRLCKIYSDQHRSSFLSRHDFSELTVSWRVYCWTRRPAKCSPLYRLLVS